MSACTHNHLCGKCLAYMKCSTMVCFFLLQGLKSFLKEKEDLNGQWWGFFTVTDTNPGLCTGLICTWSLADLLDTQVPTIFISAFIFPNSSIWNSQKALPICTTET